MDSQTCTSNGFTLEREPPSGAVEGRRAGLEEGRGGLGVCGLGGGARREGRVAVPGLGVAGEEEGVEVEGVVGVGEPATKLSCEGIRVHLSTSTLSDRRCPRSPARKACWTSNTAKPGCSSISIRAATNAWLKVRLFVEFASSAICNLSAQLPPRTQKSTADSAEAQPRRDVHKMVRPPHESCPATALTL